MRKKMSKQLLATLLAATTVVVSLAGCGQKEPEKTSEVSQSVEKTQEVEASSGVKESTEEVVDKSKLPTLTLFSYNSGLPGGLVEGFRGDYFAENGFNLEVWAYSDEKLTAIVNSGDLPDIMFVTKGDNLNALIENEMIINFDDYLEKLPNLYAFENAEQLKASIAVTRQLASNGTGGLYGIPFNSGSQNRTHGFSRTGTSQVALKWDVYEQIGAPEIKDYWELIDVMEEMLKAQPTAEDGTKMYGTILDNGDDGSYWGCMYTWFMYQGYNYMQLPYMMELNTVADEPAYILSKDSKYYEGLRWYNEIYRRGLMDPDSINTDRGTQAKKIDAGYAMVPAGTLPGYQPIYYPYYIPDTNIYASQVVASSNQVAVINAETEHLEECLNFINMWLDPETYLELQYGNEGSIWKQENGVAYLTDEFKEWLKAGNNENGFKMSDGTAWSYFNVATLALDGTYTSYKDKDGNPLQAAIGRWSDYVNATQSGENATLNAWKKTMGYDSWNELVDDKGVFYGDAEYDYYKGFLSSGPSEDAMKLTKSSLRDIMVNGSWLAVYAETEADFDAAWDKMVAEAEAGGAKELYQWRLDDFANARKLAGR